MQTLTTKTYFNRKYLITGNKPLIKHIYRIFYFKWKKNQEQDKIHFCKNYEKCSVSGKFILYGLEVFNSYIYILVVSKLVR